MKVRALKTYKEKNIQDSELKRIPEEGEIFEVEEERAKKLLGDNPFKVAFIELLDKPKEKEVVIEEATLPKKEEKAIKKKNVKKH